jgi:hypothetical protein
MKIVLSLCCVALAMLLHPIALKNESGTSFRTINIHQREIGYSYFDSMAITSSQDFKAFLEEISQQLYWNNRQDFVDALLKAQVDFNQEALVLLRHDEGSGAVRVSFETPVLQEKTLLCEIRGELRGLGTADMAYHCFALAVSKSLVNKVQLNAVAGLDERPRPTILLSTTERQPLTMRRDTPPQKPSPSDCPKLILGCPTDLLETGKTYLVRLLVEGGNPKDDVNYNWSVSGAEIVGGQGTRSLEVRINHPNKIVKAWVELGGINPYCDRMASCSCGPSR